MKELKKATEEKVIKRRKKKRNKKGKKKKNGKKSEKRESKEENQERTKELIKKVILNCADSFCMKVGWDEFRPWHRSNSLV